AWITGALNHQEAELSGVSSAVEIVHRHRVRVIPARARRRGRELVTPGAVRWNHRRSFFLGTIDVGGNQQPVKVYELRRIRLIDYVHRDRRAFFHAHERTGRGAVVADRAHDPVRCELHGDGGDLEVE